VLSVGAWQLGWFIREKNVNKAGQVAQQSYARQVGVADHVSELAVTITQIDTQIAALPSGELRSQRAALVSQLCEQAAQLNDTAQPSASARTLIVKECK
jgi:hypothetical protein